MYILHSSPDSAALIVRLVLEDLGVPYEARLIDRAAGQLDSPGYRMLQPLGKIPALETADGPMFETAAIVLFLSEKHGALAPRPSDPDRAAFLTWLFFAATNINPTVNRAFYPDRVAGPAASPAVVAHAGPLLRQFFTILDQMVAKDHPTFLSTEPSVLGYYLAVHLRWLAGFAPGHPARMTSAEFPALHAICAALETLPAALACASAEALGPTLFTNPV